MTLPIMIPWEKRDRNRSLPLRVRTRLAIAGAWLLARLPALRLRRVLERLCHGVRPSTFDEATAARRSVLSASMPLHGWHACLARSLAIALLCRIEGHWPTWCSGVTASPPPRPHSWIQVGDRPVGEPEDLKLALLMTVPNGPRRGTSG
ncbi:lasso peptide biosynthesis B2 protein [Amycolatopsis cihanbeyliensis]|uniref:Transglutaminase superfamily protein n=1 Tax=Amycolatopsis cihanbeyliensis TaxID=1128664 RepID=A0A542DE47_AMYCI|nr:lasso peptide biosynthesis B2 protein [Amycolatopsis cihanbeyliensis]TQJ01343.1 transglutaminase superfamily protein [Amycolatopsis cihanbeyliensis]